MNPFSALVALLLLLAAATLIGVLLRRRSARVRSLDGERSEELDPELFGIGEFGATGTVVQFSTEFCSRCPGVRRLLTELVEPRPGIEFAHVDLTNDPELARRFSVLQTPTLLLLDSRGVARTRLSGQLSRTSITTALEELAGGTP